jgi:hypothetical protein
LRGRLPLFPEASLTFESAGQWGSYGSRSRRAWGGYFHLDYEGLTFLPSGSVGTLGGIFLSGDNTETDDYEGWDPLFSRWPKWSESIIYTLIPETGGRVAYWSNFGSLYGSLKIPIFSRATAIISLHHLLGLRDLPSDNYFFGGSGNTRGELFITRINMTFNKSTTGHFVWEHLSPGNFYPPDSQSFNWIRFELMFRF